MKTPWILLLATVIPLGWIVLGVIVLWRFVVVRCQQFTDVEGEDYDAINWASLFSYCSSASFISAR